MYNYLNILLGSATKTQRHRETQKYLCESLWHRVFVAKKPLKRIVFILFAIVFTMPLLSQERKVTISGTVLEGESSTPMPYVYLINQTNGNGTITDYNGRFSIIAKNTDTLVFSYIGFARKKYPVSLIKNLSDSTKRPLKVIMRTMMIELAPVTAFSYKIKQNEIDYMKRYIKQHAAVKGLNAFQSPITAMYDQFSRKGKENRKLQQIFEQILVHEEVEKKFNAEILRQLTEDEFIDFEAFRRYCWYVSDQYILSHEGYDLYAPIMDCYRRWKSDGK